MNLHRLGAIVLKELRQLRRDRLTFAMIVGIPIMQLVLFGYAINMDVRGLDAAVLDQADTALPRGGGGDRLQPGGELPLPPGQPQEIDRLRAPGASARRW